MPQAKPPVHKARKRFGQNFLQDESIIDRIVNAVSPSDDDTLVEIGPGLGALTEKLLDESPLSLDVVELDRDLIPILRTKFFNYPQFSIHEADALQFDFNQLQRDDKPLRLIGNLPYNISTPLIFHLLEHSTCVQDMHFMLQKEVVERMGAQPGDKQYGRLSIMTQYYCRVMPLFEVPPESFDPVPKVMSAIVRLVPHDEKPCEVNDVSVLQKLLQASFSKRRKTLRNALKDWVNDEAFEALGLDSKLRPENLSLEDFARMSNYMSSLGKGSPTA